MNIIGKLFVCGEERELLYTDLNYRMFTWENGKPTSALLGGNITVVFESQMYDDSFIEWMIANRFGRDDLEYSQKLYSPRDGKIVFYEDNQDDVALFEYNFKDAVPVYFHEEFHNQYSMRVTMTISAAMQDYRFFDNSTSWRAYSPTRYILPWKESYIPPRKNTNNTQQDTTERITCYYTDLQGNKKVEPTTGDELYLVVNSQNAIGKIVDIDLSDHSKDFIYKDKVIENDIIKDFNITSNEHKLKLKVIAQQPEPINIK